MSEAFKYIAGFITAVIGAWGTVWLQRAKNQGNNENIYAEHTEELFRRIDKLTTDLEKRTQERDDLKEQVLSLKGQVRNLEIKIDKLSQEFNEESKNDGSEKYDKNSKD
ncbi:hypothetical protein CPEBRM1_ABPJDJAI_01140 [Companilactobacillus paralimentarius]|uniref:hypothetical protein n=1 Tax=Companilactobacillus paralimentarius TaxID=83526 RepID=UPI00384D2048